jgi:hypothetical protein
MKLKLLVCSLMLMPAFFACEARSVTIWPMVAGLVP